jgi:hypothetical protein
MADFNQNPINQASLALSGPGLGLGLGMGSDAAAATLRSDTTVFLTDGSTLGASISAGPGPGNSGGGDLEPTSGQIWPRWLASS